MATAAILSFREYAILMQHLCSMSAISAANRQSPKTDRNFGVFRAGDPLKVNLKASNPQQARARIRTRRLSY